MHFYAPDLPQTWTSERLKFNTYIKGRIGWQGLRAEEFGDVGCLCVTGTDFINGEISWESCYKITEQRYQEDPAIHLRRDDLLVTKDGTIGKLALVKHLPGPATLNSGVFVTRPTSNRYDPRFLYWVLASPDFQTFVELESNGSTINHLFQNVFENFSMPLPPRAQQDRIANFLDEKTARIDALIAEKERLDGLLGEYRSSWITATVTGHVDVETGAMFPGAHEGGGGVSTLCPLPTSLPLRPLKYIAPLRGEKVDSVPSHGEYLGLEQIESWTGKLSGVELTQAPEGGANVFYPGDVLFGKLRPYLAKAWVADRTGYCTTESLVLQPAAADSRFIRYCLLTPQAVSAINGSTYGTKMPRADWGFVGALQLPLPTRSEQTRIANFLDEQTARIDALREHCKAHVALLCEYRSSMISAAVTGQLDIDHQ